MGVGVNKGNGLMRGWPGASLRSHREGEGAGKQQKQDISEHFGYLRQVFCN